MPKSSSRQNHLQRGAALHRQGNALAAVREYSQHLSSHPLDRTGHYHLGLALEHCGQPDAAASAYARALEIDPYYPEALNNLGILLHRQQRLDAARLCFARALAARPEYSDAEYNYATAESDAGNYQNALLHFSRVLERRPNRVDAWTNLAKTFLALREPAEAQRACQIALTLNPQAKDAAWNSSLASLTLGQMPAGWDGFELRHTPRHTEIPRWRGETLDGKHLLVHAEQGAGDTIQFVRYCSHVLADHITVECHSELVCLFDDPARYIPFGTKVRGADFQIPLMSLPRLFATDLTSVPAEVPYLQADPLLVEQWEKRVRAPGNHRKVGLAWAGNPKHRHDRTRSMDPVLLQALATIDNVSFYCLQQQPLSAPAYSHFLPFAGIFDQITFRDTAAILMNLDLVISVDTAVAHLAGALGRPVWTMLPYAPDWRWMLERSDTPWYPTMRLFRQEHLNDWASVMAVVATELRNFHSDR